MPSGNKNISEYGKRTRFKKGNKAGVGHGRPPSFLTELKELCGLEFSFDVPKSDIIQCVGTFLVMPNDQVEAIANAEGVSAYIKYIARLVMRGYSEANPQIFKMLMTICYGSESLGDGSSGGKGGKQISTEEYEARLSSLFADVEITNEEIEAIKAANETD